MPSITYQLAAEAAPLMPGDGWTVRPSAASGKEGAALEHPDGRRVEISPARREGYVRARVAYPDTSYYLTEHHRPWTEMRADRGGRALEQAIRTKLLPVYNETYPKVLAANEESRKHAEARAALADHLAALVPGTEVTRSEPSPIVEYRKGGTIERVTAQILGDGLNILTFRYVDDAATTAVMKAYGDRKGPTPMTTPAAVAGRVAEILGGGWKADAGPWETYGRLDAPDTDTYTLHVDDHGELCLWANLDPNGEIASFREMRTPEGIEAVAEAIAEAIRQHHTAADQE